MPRVPPPLIALTLVAAAAVALAWTAPAAAIGALDRAVAVLDNAAGWAGRHNDPTGRAVFTTLAVALVALAFVAAWHRASSPRRAVRVAGGRGTIPVDELASCLSAAASDAADVRDATVQVENRHRRGVAVAVTLKVTAEARLQAATAGATARIEAVLAERVGVPLAQPVAVRLRYRELRLHPRRTDG